MDKKITEQESLKIINEMISEARNNFNDESAKGMERMGYAVIAVSLLNIILLFLLENSYNAYYIWLLLIPISFIDYCISRKKEDRAVMHVEKIIEAVWSAFGFVIPIFISTVITWSVAANHWTMTALIMPVILLFTASATYVTGAAYRFSPYRRGGVIFALGALVCIGIGLNPYYSVLQFVVLILCILFGFIVPSRQLKKTTVQDV